jgi:transposase
VLVHPANLTDRVAAPQVFWRLAQQHLWLRLSTIYADGGYNGPLVADTAAQLGFKVEVVSPPPGTKGFVPVPQRWKVERAFAWLNKCRQPRKDYDQLTESSEASIHLAMTRLLLRRLVT